MRWTSFSNIKDVLVGPHGQDAAVLDDLEGGGVVLDADIVVDEEFGHGEGHIHARVIGGHLHVLEQVLDGEVGFRDAVVPAVQHCDVVQ